MHRSLKTSPNSCVQSIQRPFGLVDVWISVSQVGASKGLWDDLGVEIYFAVTSKLEDQQIGTFSSLADDGMKLSDHFGLRLVVRSIAIDSAEKTHLTSKNGLQ